MASGDNGATRNRTEDRLKTIFDTTTDAISAILRGSIRGWGSTLVYIGQELEEISEDLESDEE